MSRGAARNRNPIRANGGGINIVFTGSAAAGTSPSRTAVNFGTYRAVLEQ